MRFIVSSGLLHKNLQSVSGVIGGSTILPILESFLFIIENQILTVVSTDLETTMKVRFEIQASENGRLCIQSKVLIDYLKNLPEQPITFDIHMEDFAIDITSEQGKYKIVGEDAANYPTEPVADNTTDFAMSANELSDGIAKALIAVSTDDMRPAMGGVLFELNSHSLTLVSTDAHRLVRCIKSGIECPSASRFIVPRKTLQQLKNNLNASFEVTLSFNENHLFVKSDNFELSCRLIEGRFPDYKMVIPADNPFKLILNKTDFISALRRVSVFANRTTHQVVLDIVGNNLHLYGQDVDFSFEGNEQMPCQYSGEDMKVAFNSKLLLELAVILEGEEILIEMSTPNRACLLKQLEDRPNEDLLILIMPLMIGM